MVLNILIKTIKNINIILVNIFMKITIYVLDSSVQEENVMTLDTNLFAKFIFIIGHIALE